MRNAERKRLEGQLAADARIALGARGCGAAKPGRPPRECAGDCGSSLAATPWFISQVPMFVSTIITSRALTGSGEER